MDWAARFGSFKLGGKFGSCRPNPYAIVGSFATESIVTTCSPGDPMDDIVIISRVLLPEISVEMRTIGVFRLSGLGHWTIVRHTVSLNYWVLKKLFETSSILKNNKMQLNIKY